MAQGETCSVLHPGDMILIDSAKPSEFTFFGDRSQQMSLHLPRVDLEDRFGPKIPNGLGLERNDPTALAIHAIVEKSLQNKDLGTYLQDALLSLVGVLLLERKAGQAGSKDTIGPGDESTLSGPGILRPYDRD